MQIKIQNYQFTIELEDTDTVQAFVALLPLEVEMEELKGNEKYHYLSTSLPTHAYQPREIKKGDFMLYGSNCLVLFYQSFSSSYRYTRLGQVVDVTHLEEAVGKGDVTVSFHLLDE